MSVKKIAQLAGVSVATVSRILNNVPGVKQSTVEKVTAIIHETGYQPNLSARQLRTARTSTILVIFSDITNPFFSAVLASIEKAAIAQGYRILLSNAQCASSLMADIVSLTTGKAIAGIISFDTISLDIHNNTFCHTIPWVLCGENDHPSHFSSVGIDDHDAAYATTKRLLTAGRKKIALINHDSRLTYATKREEGYARALNESASGVKRVARVGEHTLQSGREALDSLFSTTDCPDAIIAVSDLLAIGAIHQARQLGIRVPEDLAIIGFDDIAFSEVSDPPLSTVRQPADQMGNVAVALLLNKLASPDAPAQNVTLKWTFVERGTHGPS